MQRYVFEKTKYKVNYAAKSIIFLLLHISLSLKVCLYIVLYKESENETFTEMIRSDTYLSII